MFVDIPGSLADVKDVIRPALARTWPGLAIVLAMKFGLGLPQREAYIFVFTLKV